MSQCLHAYVFVKNVVMNSDLKPLYNVGDVVTINKIKNTSTSDYPFGFTGEMAIYKKGCITSVRKYQKESYNQVENQRKMSYMFDGYIYKLDCDSGRYYWSSPMFLETQQEL